MSEVGISIFNTHGRDDEVALGQLGAAVVILWRALDQPMRDELSRHARAISGIEIVSDFQLRITVTVHLTEDYGDSAFNW